ncbi:hypothetical protein AN220_13165, partial [Streptomyces nanshensis]
EPSWLTALPDRSTGAPGRWHRTRPAASSGARAAGTPSTGRAAHPGREVPYSVDGWFDESFAATREHFPSPLATSTERSTVWGEGHSDPDLHMFVAELPGLGLRGEYNPAGPSAGQVTDADGRLYSEGPAWDWYLAGRGLVASSRLRTILLAQDVEGTADDPGVVPVPAAWPASGPVSATPPVPPVTVAAVQHLLSGPDLQLLDVQWRVHEGPLHTFSSQPPQEVFEQGLLPEGDELLHPIEHVVAGDGAASAWVGTTADPNTGPAAGSGWRVFLQAPGGVDVNATLGLASPFPDRFEVLFPGGVDRRFIRGAQLLENGEPVGDFLPNPHFGEGGEDNRGQGRNEQQRDET